MWHFGPIIRSMFKRKLNVFLMVFQLAIVMAIFSSLGDVAKSIYDNAHVESGIDEHAIFAVTVRPVNAFLTYDKVQRDLRDIKQLPFIEGVNAMRWTPVSMYGEGVGIRIDKDKEAAITMAAQSVSTHEIFKTLDLPIIAGRDFTLEDMAIIEDDKFIIQTASIFNEKNNSGPRVVIVSDALAKTLFGSAEQAVGKFIYEGDHVREIVGVSADWWGFMRRWDGSRELTLFKPQHLEQTEEYRYLIRVSDPKLRNKLVEDALAIVYRNHNDNVLLWVEKVNESRASVDRPNFIYAWLLIIMIVVLGFVIGFAIAAQMLFLIAQRFKQIGIRRALGASQRDIVIHLQTENMLLCGMGLFFGLPLTLLISDIIIKISRGGTPISPWVMLLSALVLVSICFYSAALSLRKVAVISPSAATRSY